MHRIFNVLIPLLLLCSTSLWAETKADTSKATDTVEVIEATSIALRNKPVYPPDFTHFKYVNPDAPLGGTIHDYTIGTFDNFNAYAQQGDAAIGSGSMNDSLMTSSSDDISAYYPLVAKKIEYASDYSWIIFHVDERARFHDGEPIKASDVKFSFEKITGEGLPGLKAAYKYVEKIEVLDKQRVKFHLSTRERANMIWLCGFTILPEHFWKDHKLDKPLKEVPVGSSAYRISDYKMGKYVVIERLKDYWAKDLPAMKGLLNEDFIRYDYYRDATVAFEAFKAGHIDKWRENTSKRWATQYNFPAIKDRRVIKEEIKDEEPVRVQAFVFNTKKTLFQDRRVRKALAYLMDFEWMNKNLFYDQYTRVNSFFMGTEYEAKGLPSDKELAVLASIKDQVPTELFKEAFALPTTKGDGNIRGNLRQALRLLKQAGWAIKNQKLVHTKTGKPFEFELLLVQPSMEKVALPFKNNLARAGINMNIRKVDTSRYMNLRIAHDYDMIISGYGPYIYPTARMHQQWHSESISSGFNLANVEDKTVDYLMDEALKYQTDDSKLIPIGKAIDRVLLNNYYIIPQWTSRTYRVAYWNKFVKPEHKPKYDLGDSAWWIDAEKAKALDK